MRKQPDSRRPRLIGAGAVCACSLACLLVLLLSGPENGSAQTPSCSPHWRTVAAPPGARGTLSAVAAVSSSDVCSVGAQVEHWDGRHWSLVAAPARAGGILADIAAVTSDDIWAVGRSGPKRAPRALIVHWDGRHWKRFPLPGVPSRLAGVAAVAAKDVWAVGDSDTVLHWNGTTWTRIA